MKMPWPTVVGWYHAVLLSVLPWCAWWQPRWAPLVVAAAAVVHLQVRRSRATEPWSSGSVAISALVFLLLMDGWRGSAWVWLVLAAAVAASARWLSREDGDRPDAADLVALVGWAMVFAAAPNLLVVEAGGWLAPAVLFVAARQIGVTAMVSVQRRRKRVGPPTREVRGTLSLRGVVATDGRLPVTIPMDLDLRAGDSMAVLCESLSAAQVLADVVAGRRRPFDGEIFVDGSPVGPDDRVAAVVAPGEPFIAGSLDDNLGALRDDVPDRAARGAARDACGLGEVVQFLDGRSLAVDGEPLEPYFRLLVLAARVLVSHYRVLVVVDPGPWVDARLTDLWRAALVRASVGRTAIWITNDVDLADRADHVYEYAQGVLKRS